VASGARGQGGVITGINVTPLVDITLVLLIIFIVTARLIVNHKAIELDLPSAASGSDVQEIFSVALTAAGQTEVNGQTVGSDEELLTRARAARAGQKDLRALIKADGVFPHRRVMRALDLLKQAGVSRIGFGVVPVAALPTAPGASS